MQVHAVAYCGIDRLTMGGCLVLALGDPGLRSMLAGQLGMAGEMPISVLDHRDRTLTATIRAGALLIIAEALIGSAPQDWLGTLRGQGWVGQIVVIVETKPPTYAVCNSIVVVQRADAGAAVLPLVHFWRTRRNGRVS